MPFCRLKTPLADCVQRSKKINITKTLDNLYMLADKCNQLKQPIILAKTVAQRPSQAF